MFSIRDLVNASLASSVVLACVSSAAAQVTVINDDFGGGFDSAWDTTDGSGTTPVFDPGNAAGGSSWYGRVEGVSGSGGGLGVSFAGLDTGSLWATDFAISLNFRVDNTPATQRQFTLGVSANTDTPASSNVTTNLRYQDGTWSAFNGAWTPIAGLGSVASNQWHSLLVTGSNWGSGISGNATYDVQVTDHLGTTTSVSGLQLFHQGSADSDGARSFTLNDNYGNNPGFDVDNVFITATPAAAPPPAPSSPPTTNITTVTPVNPVAYSGIYAHTAVTNDHREVGIGGLINRNGTLYYMTYGPHVVRGGSDRLYSVDTSDLAFSTYNDYPGGTHANRYTDTNLGLDIIGAAYIDSSDNVRLLPIGNFPTGLEGRITGTAAHLTDPNKLYYMTMEEGLYEVDFTDLNNPVVTELKPDRNGNQSTGDYNLPGVHGKGLYTGQGHMYFTNNGGGGVLAEWDGTGDPNTAAAWTVVDRNNYTEVTSRRGPVDMSANSTDAVWAIGWDDQSVLFNVRDAATGEWTRFRMPKGSYTHDADPGWFTEWPRIRDIGLEDGQLLSHHGTMFLVPETFSVSNYGGLMPIANHHKMIVDYVEDGDQIIFAGNDASSFSNGLAGQVNSNIMFINKSDLPNYGGNAFGAGGVFLNDNVSADEVSEAFLIAGYQERVLHIEHNSGGSRDFVLEVDENGTGNWVAHSTVTVDEYGYALLPENLNAQWLRVRSQSATSGLTAYMHLTNDPNARDQAMTQSLVEIGTPTARSQGVIRGTTSTNLTLEFGADILDASGNITGTGYYQARLDSNNVLELVPVNDASAEASLRSQAATTQDFGVDAASVFIDDDGTRFRLPFGDEAYSTDTASGARRGEREVVTERAVMNIHGTFYELPRSNSGGMWRIQPITTHHQDIYDYASWRGMLVLSGVAAGGAADGHYLESSDGQVGLWFGNVDDLWSFGAPEGVGGPWKDTVVSAGQASDPYLMYGYDQKMLELTHDANEAVTFTIQVDFLGTNTWEDYGQVVVEEGQTLVYVFEEGYSAHWVRLVSDTNTTATAWFTYSGAQIPEPGTAALLLAGLPMLMVRRRRGG